MTISSQQNSSFFIHGMIALNLIIVSPDPPSSLPFKMQLKTFLQSHFCADSLRDALEGILSHFSSWDLRMLPQEFQQPLAGLGRPNKPHTAEAAEQLQGQLSPCSGLATGPWGTQGLDFQSQTR